MWRFVIEFSAQEVAKRVKAAKAEAEEAKIAELEKLRKKHDMLSMSLEEDAKRKTKTLQVPPIYRELKRYTKSYTKS